MKLTDGIVFVTGASGLGAASARALKERGAQVVLADLPSSEGAKVAADIGVQYCPVDVTDAEVLGASLAEIAAAGLRGVIHCAGIVGRTPGAPGFVLDRQTGAPLALENFDHVVRVNLTGTFNVVRLAAAQMMANEPVDGEKGVIVCTASAAAFDGTAGQAAYAASKAGVVGMTLPLARDLAPYGIRIATIAPGMFDTPILQRLPEHARAEISEAIPNPARPGRPSEFARLALEILENGYVNGTTYRLDAALRLG